MRMGSSIRALLLGAGGVANKQLYTIPNAVIGTLSSLLGTLGGSLGREILYLGSNYVSTPIWDILTPRRGWERAGEHFLTRVGSPATLIRQEVSVGLARLRVGALGGRFGPDIYIYIGTYNSITYIGTLLHAKA